MCYAEHLEPRELAAEGHREVGQRIRCRLQCPSNKHHFTNVLAEMGPGLESSGKFVDCGCVMEDDGVE